jgi:tetratricopeptide (TPR) repeat protein
MEVDLIQQLHHAERQTMLTTKCLYRCAAFALLTVCLACNSNKANTSATATTAPAESDRAIQPPPGQSSSSQPAVRQQPAQKQQPKSISYAKNPERFVKQVPSDVPFNITDPKTAQEHFNVAVNFDHQNQLDKAIAEYEKVLELKPDWALAHFRMAQDYQKRGRTDEAVAQWGLATKYDPQFYAAYDLLSAAYARQGNLKKAIEAYSPMLNYPPARMPTHYQLGIWYAQLGEVPQAREHLEAYRELALNSKSVEVQSDRYQKATKELQKLKQ